MNKAGCELAGDKNYVKCYKLKEHSEVSRREIASQERIHGVVQKAPFESLPSWMEQGNTENRKIVHLVGKWPAFLALGEKVTGGY